MTVILTGDEATKLKRATEGLLDKRRSLLHLSQVLGLMVAWFPGVQYGTLFYWRYDTRNKKVLKVAAGYCNVPPSLPNEGKVDS